MCLCYVDVGHDGGIDKLESTVQLVRGYPDKMRHRPTLSRKANRQRPPIVFRIGSAGIITCTIHIILFIFLLLVLPSLERKESAPILPSTAADQQSSFSGISSPNTAADQPSSSTAITGNDGDPSSPIATTIAYAISVTSCGGRDEGITDGAAVLAYSIRRQKAQGSRYDSKLYAFVHPVAQKCSSVLADLGYEVRIHETPINATEIKGEFLRRTIQIRGCCQEKELLKLYAYTLSEKVAVHLDVDSLILKPLDALFDAIINGVESSPLDKEAMEIHGNNTVPKRVDAFFTRDYNLASRGKLAGMQGGFLVVRPSMDVYEEYRQIVLEGRHFKGSGWDRKGHGGYYGAQQIQGLVAHYYDFVKPGTGIELNRCLYNAMVDHPRDKKGFCRNGEKDCEDCRARKAEDIVSAHFTLCQKPWKCISLAHYPKLCAKLHRQWFLARKELEVERGTFVEINGNHNPDVSLHYCKGNRARSYTPLKIGR